MILNALTIAGTDRKSLLAKGSLSIEDQLNQRDTCSFTLRDPSGAARPLVGQVVQITLDGALRFAGTIDRFTEANVTNRFADTLVEYEIECVDANQLADRRLHAEVYDDFTMKAIVQDLLNEELAADGVTLDLAFPTGPTIDYFVLNYDTMARAFDQLSEITGYMWNIGPDKVLRFIDRTTMTAPVALNQSSGADLIASLKIVRTREQYRNEQLIRGGQTKTDTTQIEQFKGNGEQQTFSVALPIAQVPTVKVNAVTKTVGIRQVETGKDWYWQESSTEISQEFSATKLTASDILRVEYIGYFPLLTLHKEDAAVAERQTIEGGSGLYQHLESDEDITNAQLARDRAAGLIRRFGTINTEIEFESRVTGWQAGQLLTVDRAEHGLSGQFLIASIALEHQQFDEYRWSIRAVSGEAVESWVAFFQRLAEARLISRRSQNEAKSQVLNIIRTSNESVTVSETQSVTQPAESIWHVGDQIGLVEVAA